MHFFLRIFDEFFSGFRAKFQKIVTCVAFSIKFAKTNQKLPKILNFVKKIHYYSKLFTSLLTKDDEAGLRLARSSPRARRAAPLAEAFPRGAKCAKFECIKFL